MQKLLLKECDPPPAGADLLDQWRKKHGKQHVYQQASSPASSTTSLGSIGAGCISPDQQGRHGVASPLSSSANGHAALESLGACLLHKWRQQRMHSHQHGDSLHPDASSTSTMPGRTYDVHSHTSTMSGTRFVVPNQLMSKSLDSTLSDLLSKWRQHKEPATTSHALISPVRRHAQAAAFAASPGLNDLHCWTHQSQQQAHTQELVEEQVTLQQPEQQQQQQQHETTVADSPTGLQDGISSMLDRKCAVPSPRDIVNPSSVSTLEPQLRGWPAKRRLQAATDAVESTVAVHDSATRACTADGSLSSASSISVPDDSFAGDDAAAAADEADSIHHPTSSEATNVHMAGNGVMHTEVSGNNGLAASTAAESQTAAVADPTELVSAAASPTAVTLPTQDIGMPNWPQARAVDNSLANICQSAHGENGSLVSDTLHQPMRSTADPEASPAALPVVQDPGCIVIVEEPVDAAEVAVEQDHAPQRRCAGQQAYLDLLTPVVCVSSSSVVVVAHDLQQESQQQGAVGVGELQLDMQYLACKAEACVAPPQRQSARRKLCLEDDTASSLSVLPKSLESSYGSESTEGSSQHDSAAQDAGVPSSSSSSGSNTTHIVLPDAGHHHQGLPASWLPPLDPMQRVCVLPFGKRGSPASSSNQGDSNAAAVLSAHKLESAVGRPAQHPPSSPNTTPPSRGSRLPAVISHAKPPLPHATKIHACTSQHALTLAAAAVIPPGFQQDPSAGHQGSEDVQVLGHSKYNECAVVWPGHHAAVAAPDSPDTCAVTQTTAVTTLVAVTPAASADNSQLNDMGLSKLLINVAECSDESAAPAKATMMGLLVHDAVASLLFAATPSPTPPLSVAQLAVDDDNDSISVNGEHDVCENVICTALFVDEDSDERDANAVVAAHVGTQPDPTAAALLCIQTAAAVSAATPSSQQQQELSSGVSHAKPTTMVCTSEPAGASEQRCVSESLQPAAASTAPGGVHECQNLADDLPSNLPPPAEATLVVGQGSNRDCQNCSAAGHNTDIHHLPLIGEAQAGAAGDESATSCRQAAAMDDETPHQAQGVSVTEPASIEPFLGQEHSNSMTEQDNMTEQDSTLDVCDVPMSTDLQSVEAAVTPVSAGCIVGAADEGVLHQQCDEQLQDPGNEATQDMCPAEIICDVGQDTAEHAQCQPHTVPEVVLSPSAHEQSTQQQHTGTYSPVGMQEQTGDNGESHPGALASVGPAPKTGVLHNSTGQVVTEGGVLLPLAALAAIEAQPAAALTTPASTTASAPAAAPSAATTAPAAATVQLPDLHESSPASSSAAATTQVPVNYSVCLPPLADSITGTSTVHSGQAAALQEAASILCNAQQAYETISMSAADSDVSLLVEDLLLTNSDVSHTLVLSNADVADAAAVAEGSAEAVTTACNTIAEPAPKAAALLQPVLQHIQAADAELAQLLQEDAADTDFEHDPVVMMLRAKIQECLIQLQDALSSGKVTQMAERQAIGN